MSSITRFEEREEQIYARLRERPGLEGYHVTYGIYCNVKSWHSLRNPDAEPEFDESTLLRFLMAHGMAAVLEEGQVSQIQAVTPEDNSVGTLDIWWRNHPVEIKVSYVSVNKPISEMEHWLLQVAEYAARAVRPDTKRPWGELWIVHLLGDHGRKFCPEHGVPPMPESGSVKDRPRAEHPDTGALRLVCPECGEFLVEGQRDTLLRCHRIEWTRDELDAIHSMLSWRQQQLRDDVENAEYGEGQPPPIRWGYPFECERCPIKERYNCPTMHSGQDLTDALEGSILQLEGARQ